MPKHCVHCKWMTLNRKLMSHLETTPSIILPINVVFRVEKVLLIEGVFDGPDLGKVVVDPDPVGGTNQEAADRGDGNQVGQNPPAAGHDLVIQVSKTIFGPPIRPS